MSVDGTEPRRPRRIAVADLDVAAVSLGADPPLQRERFRRVVDAAALALNGEPSAAEFKSALRPPGRRPLPVPAKPPAQKPDPLDEGPRAMVPAVMVQVPLIATPAHRVPEPSAMEDSGWEQPLARLVQKLSSNADPSFTQWSVQIPLDERVLPGTSLHITLSLHHLQLRFNTQSAWSHRLIFTSTSALLQSLQTALPHVQDIDIDIT